MTDMTPISPADRHYLDVWGVAKSFKGTRVMSGMNFRVDRGELVSLLGPSGCGKTTLLRIIAGLMEADDGSVVLGGRDITRQPAHRRNISVVFQSYALFPHLTVAENVAFGLRARGTAKSATAAPVAEALRLVRMSDFADRPIAALSGGQQQRVAVARALVVGPDLLLLDEPFSALDRKLRETMQVELKSLLRDRGITAIFVTHDQEEAMGVSDRIAVMNAGRIEQFADPSTLYARPASPFVMDFVGLSTRLAARVTARDGDLLSLETALGPVRAPGDLAPGSAALLAVRPELVALGQGENTLSVTLEDVMVLGSKTMLHGRAPEGDRILCELPGIRTGLARGETVSLGWAVADTLVYGVDP
ncbi:ABC transporter ATP-binding protein [Salipiger marinus]|uniref:Putative spermidine/putrescine transport system ATP-binding protein n=2 Tax=Salipiger marinus TaxID=555512 RepID=A0A1G8LIU4_9RHOB|nr:ABC transporter ATP-binding protein [Salipiger marinus]SDI55649.1 putative spermidine/putrescine transport system ATP-binding protein [Salipiger marinus]